MSFSSWRPWVSHRAQVTTQRRRKYRPILESLEERSTPATHAWSGAINDLMSLDGNWKAGGHPVSGESTPIVLIFPSTAATFNVVDDLDGLNVDQIQFIGTSKNYVISGAAGGVTLNLTGLASSQPNLDDQVGGNTFGDK